MKLGIIGLPNVGKSTLFNAVTNAGAQSANYPFCTIEPNMGMVSVPDKRLDILNEMYGANKLTRATIEFLDIAGLVKGASSGEGLGNKFLSHIRETDAIIHVVRCFEDTDVIHVNGQIDPIKDIEIINLELVISDIEMLEKRIDKIIKLLKTDKKYQNELDLVKSLKKYLEDGNSARNYKCKEEEQEMLKLIPLLSAKPVIYAANLSEKNVETGFKNNKGFNKINELSESEGTVAIPILAKLEEELANMEKDEKDRFLKDLGLQEPGLDALIKAGYSMLNLISFLTAGKSEVRAWPIKAGTKASKAAGKIHTDFERGFIKAEIIGYDDLVACGSVQHAKEKGLIRLEGKEYVMQDGDIALFRFNV